MAAGDSFKVGVSGLQVFQRSLNTIGHNITNSQTEGFSRQRVELATRFASPSGNGFIGNGVDSTAVRRMFDQNAIDQVRTRLASSEYFSIYNQFSSQVDNLLADPDAGLSPAIESFFAAVQEVANDPVSIPAREVMLIEGEGLVDRFLTMQDWLSDLQGAANDHIRTQVSTVNRLSESIADYNEQIIVARGMASGQDPNDLLDKRDLLIDRLSKHVNVNVLELNDGTVDVFVGNGQSLVLAAQSMQLQARPNPDDPTNMEVAYVDNSTNTLSSITSMLSGGDLGGVLQFRDEILTPSINSLGRLAIAIATTFNEQHQKGMDLTNTMGGSFFNAPTLTAEASFNNTGGVSASIALNDIKDLTTDEFELKWNGVNYTIRNLATNEIVNPGFVAVGPPAELNTFKGMDISLDGIPAVGDVFYLRPNRYAARQFSMAISDPNFIAAASAVRSDINIGNNLGNGDITQPSVVDSSDPNLQQAVIFTFSNSGGLGSPAEADQFDVVGVGTGNPVAVNYTSGGDLTYNGWTVNITGKPKVGDSFTVDFNAGGFSDNRNALDLIELQVTGTMISGNASYHDAYSELVVSVGNKTSQSEISLEAQNALLGQAKEHRESISGVNLDEEAANLLRFQQAYAAAAQVITIANSVFETLLNAVRR